MRRRDLILAALAEPAFPPSASAGGATLVLNGTGTRRWSPLRIEVYRAALYLTEPSSDAEAILASPAPRLVSVRYARAVGLGDVAAAWEATLGAPLPAAFRDWLRPIAAGDLERQLFLAGTAHLEGPGRPAARVADAGFARRLLDAWIGRTADDAVRRGLLGLPR